MREYALATLLYGSVLIGSCNAAPIVGQISLFGTDTYTASSVHFDGPGGIGPLTATGSFSPAFDVGCLSCASMTDFSYVGFVGPVLVYTATIGADVTSFELDAISSATQGGGFLNIAGTGVASLTGYDDTPGTFYLSSQGPLGQRVTFSATTAAVPTPEPSSLALLSVGLLGLCVTGHRLITPRQRAG